MENIYCTRLGVIYKYAEDYYKKHHICLSFPAIISLLHNKGLLTDTPLIFRRSRAVLSQDDFLRHVLNQVVYGNMVLSNPFHYDAAEEAAFPKGKDIYTMVNLPYLYSEKHTHTYFEMLYVYTGTCTYYFEDKTLPLSQGNLILISPGSIHNVIAEPGCLALVVNIRRSTVTDTFRNLLDNDNLLANFIHHYLYGSKVSNYISFTISHTDEYNYMIQQIFDTSNCDDNYSNMICSSLLTLFFGRLLQDFGGTVQLYTDIRTDDFSRTFPMILKYVQANYQHVSLPVLSNIFHYSEAYISSMFKKYLNEYFSVIVRNIRLEHTKRYLENTKDSIEKIAEQVGYTSADYLSRAFKEKNGISPSEYRKNHSSTKNTKP